MKKFFVLLACLSLFPSASAEGYRRIVSFRPSLTEILFALGLGPRVVGVTDFCRYPPEARSVERIGGYFNRRLEKVLSLKPDLVVLVPDATTAKMASALERSRIPVLTLEADTVEDVYEAIDRIARANGIDDRGRDLIARIRTQMEDRAREAGRFPKKKTLLVIQRSPLITAGRGTFLDRLLELAGGENIAGGSSLPYPRFSMESVVAKAPEVIVDFDASEFGGSGDGSDSGDAAAFWKRYGSIPAVRNGNVRRLDPDLFTPGPRLPEALDLLIKTLHNEDP